MFLSMSSYPLMKLYSKLPSEIKGHSGRVSILASIIAEGCFERGFDPGERFSAESAESLVQLARDAGFYHDIGKVSDNEDELPHALLGMKIGKVSVPRELLTKQAGLTAAELASLEKHTLYASELLSACISSLSAAELPYYSEVMNVCVSHHERWDGNGYPYALAGKVISPFARICAVADAYDFLTNRRDGPGATHSEAAIEIIRCSGSRFDPEVVEAFSAKAGVIRQLLANRRSLA